MPAGKPQGDSRPRKRRGRYVLAGFVFTVLIVAALLLTGWPQRKLLEWALSSGLQAEVLVADAGLGGRIEASRILVFDDAQARKRNRPAVRITDLDLDYRLPADAGRYCSSLSIAELAVSLDAQDPANTNYAFVERFLSAPSTIEDPLPFVPRVIDIGRVSFEGTFPGMGVRTDGIAVRAEVDALDRFWMEVEGKNLTGSWWANDRSILNDLAGSRMTAHVAVKDGCVMVDPLDISLAGLAAIEARGGFETTEEGRMVDVTVASLSLGQTALSAWGGGLLPVPFRFDRLSFSDTRMQGVVAENTFALADSEFHVRADALGVGPEGRELYEGDLRIDGNAEKEAGRRLKATATLNRGQVADVAVESADTISCRVAFEDWSRQDVLAVVPRDYRGSLDTWSTLHQLSASAEVGWAHPHYTATVKLTAGLDEGTAETKLDTLEATLTGGGTLDAAGPLYEGNLETELEDYGSVAASFHAASLTSYEAKFTFDDVHGPRWVSALAGFSLPAETTGRVSGTLGLRPSKTGLILTPDLTASSFQYGELTPLKERGIAAKGAIEVAGSYTEATVPALTLKAGQGLELELVDWNISATPLGAAGRCNATFDLAQLGEMLGLPSLWGQGAAIAEVRVAPAAIDAEIEADISDLGYGDFAIPYGSAVAISGRSEIDAEKMEAVLTDFSAKLGEGARLTSERATGNLKSLSFEAPFAFVTDLQLAVSMGYLDAAEGKVQANGAFQNDETGFGGSFEFLVEAPSVALAGNLAALGGVALKGNAAYRDGLTGSAKFHIGEVVAAGTTLGDVHGPAALDGEDIEINGIELSLFGGTVKADATFGVLAEGMPVRLSAKALNLDLAVFTEEMKPPSVTLTGIAQGETTLRFESGELKDFQATFRSSENLTINRDILRQILLSEYVGDTGVGKIARRTMENILGEEEQRAFDSAELDLGLEDGRLVGTAVLKSEELSLSVDLHVDPGAIREALKLRQQTQLDQIDNVHMEPVQFRE